MKRSSVFGLVALVLAACGSPAAPVPTLVAPTAPVATAEPSARAGKPVEPSPEPAGRYCFDPARDVRRAGKRALALVRTEHENLATLYDATPASSEDHTALGVRLGDTESELAALEPSRADGHESDALAHYGEAAKGKGPAVFEAKYRLALDYECQGDTKDARKLLFEIVSSAPTSRLVPYAYFGFGEMFAKEAATDPTKLQLAIQSFERAATYPSPIAALTKSRLAETRAKQPTSP